VDEGPWPAVDAEGLLVTSTDRIGGIDGEWLRQRTSLRRPLAGGAVRPSLTVDLERRRQRAVGTDSLTNASFAFWEVRPAVEVRGERVDATASVEVRREDEALGGSLRNASTAWTVQTEAGYTPNAPYDVSVTGGYRVRRFTDPFRIRRQRRDTESVILQLEGTARPLDRAVEVRGRYDALTERTPTLREVYVRTGPELGQYVWRDANDDGVQQLDEFVPETTPNEGEYVQSFVPSDSLESVVNVETRLRVELTPGRLFGTTEAWWKRALSSVSTRSTVSVEEKNRSANIRPLYLLQQDRFRRPGLTLDGELRLEQQVELFRSTRAYGLDVTWRRTRGLNERAAGTERTLLRAWEAEARLKPSSAWALTASGALSTDRADSEAFAASRSFDIRSREVRPQVSYRPLPALRLSVAGAWAQKDDRLGNRQARLLRVPVEATVARAGRWRLSANAEAAQIDLTGDAVGLAQFELTDGRGPGRSYLWGLQGRYVINEYLRATVSYDGRAPSAAPPIHTFRAQLSANF
jgi:hypothetical protein